MISKNIAEFMDKHIGWMLILMVRNQQNHTVGNLTLLLKFEISNFTLQISNSRTKKKLLVLIKELDVEVKYYIKNFIKMAAL